MKEYFPKETLLAEGGEGERRGGNKMLIITNNKDNKIKCKIRYLTTSQKIKKLNNTQYWKNTYKSLEDV